MTSARPRLRWLVLLLLAGAVLVAGALLLSGGDDAPDFGAGILDTEQPDPFAYDEAREAELEARATLGHSNVVYSKSPGGALATAQRVDAWRPQVEAAAEDADVDADLVEGMVFLESAGRPEVTASTDLEGAVGLTQILAETATSLLDMRVDVRESERLTRAIVRAERRSEFDRAGRLRARRRAVDERFDAEKSLAGTARYLQFALDRLGREDLAVVSYHMGVGNLENVIGAYGEGDAEDLSYTRLFFDSTPDRHPRTAKLLASLGDDSSTYLWRVLASKEIMRLYREDLPELQRLAALHTAKASAEEVLHPRGQTDVFADPDALEEAYAGGELRPFPDRPGRLGLRRAPQMGELAERLDADPALYSGLRPEAFALAVYMAARVRELSGTEAPLIVTSTVRDRAYQRELLRGNPFATPNYSLHTTGWSFDVRRRYASRAQAVAFQHMLDRLQSLNLIAWVREPGAIHVTVSSDAATLEPLLRD